MSIKCSLLGHRFGDTTVEREREEDGSEVVITITEQETCTRCGETRVVSENKEVTTMETPDDEGTVDSSAPDLSATTSETSETDDSDVPEDGDDAVILGDDDDEADAQAEARGSPASIPDAEAGASAGDDEEGDVDADEDDAVILGDDTRTEPEDSASEVDTEPTEPADERATVDAGEPDASDETGTADVGADDADETEPRAEYQQGESSGEWPEETKPADAVTGEDAMDDWPEETKRDVGGEASGAGPDLEETASPTITVPEGMFKCSECGFETEVESSSLRAGDFCPECHQGTLMQHEDPDE